MPYKSNNTNQQSKENHGNPATGGQPKAGGDKPLGQTGAEEERLAAEYTEDGLDEVRPDLLRHPNRNLDKPDIDKPAYN